MIKHLLTLKRGFTLIEVLVALAIASIISVALFSIYISIENNLSQIEGRSLRFQEARNLLEMLSREISSAYLNRDDQRTFFVIKDRDIFGKPASVLSFTAFKERGLMSINYEVKERDKRLIIVKIEGPAFRQERMEAEIIEDIEGFLVEIPDKGNPLRTWDSELTKRLPERIRITIRININQRKIELTETVFPRLR
ncbi:MAG: prepilin-type N-terminal cleavage/methylation domain-containing protein [Thermodesulfovibrionales bacterium]|nr:prepilin-type N-terminal cleavage/methylation domain-containing protein [Thermodesulfovibrionales bacterium]